MANFEQAVLTIGGLRISGELQWSDPVAALRTGGRDFAASPGFGLFFGGIYVLGGLALAVGLTGLGQGWWLIPVMAGLSLSPSASG